MKGVIAKDTTYSFILGEHVFCDVLNMFMHITLLNNTQVSLFLNVPASQVEDMCSGKLFGSVDKAICFKLDTLFDTSSGFFYEVMKKSMLVK